MSSQPIVVSNVTQERQLQRWQQKLRQSLAGIKKTKIYQKFNVEMSASNPRDEYYLKVCFVCSEIAKPDQDHTPHYGGIVCLSCRAFFRRAHQKTRNPKFFCKNSNQCQITFKNRRRCQKCRYVRCIISGMTPEAVLSDDQKQIRFRKLLQKKKAISISGSVNVREGQKYSSADETEVIGQSIPVSFEFPQYREPEVKLEVYESFLNEFDDSGKDLGAVVWTRCRDIVQDWDGLGKDIFHSFEQSKVFVRSCNKMFQKLLSLQSGRQILQKISGKDIAASIVAISQTFRNFASLQRQVFLVRGHFRPLFLIVNNKNRQ